MPLIEFSERDMLRNTVVEPAWYRVKVDSVSEEGTVTPKGPSINYPCEGTILFNAENGNKTFEGVPVQWQFNSRAIGMIQPYLEALGVTVEAKKRYELGRSVGQEIDIFVENGEWAGRTINKINGKFRKPLQETGQEQSA